MIILIKLVLAHLVGDFLLQPDSWVRAKESRKLASWQIYVHSLIHFALIMLLILDFTFLIPAILIALFHFFTDVAKVFLQKDRTKSTMFFADQIIHFLIILSIWLFYTKDLFSPDLQKMEFYITIITFIYALTQPSSVFIRMFISRWSPDTGSSNDSLEKAGNWIGILERLFVFAFVVAGHWESVGFILAAKSIFRFGDLKESKDRKLTEYVLIGTLLSFGIAMLLGNIILKLYSK